MYNRQFDPFLPSTTCASQEHRLPMSFIGVHPKGDQSMGLVREGGGGGIHATVQITGVLRHRGLGGVQQGLEHVHDFHKSGALGAVCSRARTYRNTHTANPHNNKDRADSCLASRAQ